MKFPRVRACEALPHGLQRHGVTRLNIELAQGKVGGLAILEVRDPKLDLSSRPFVLIGEVLLRSIEPHLQSLTTFGSTLDANRAHGLMRRAKLTRVASAIL